MERGVDFAMNLSHILYFSKMDNFPHSNIYVENWDSLKEMEFERIHNVCVFTSPGVIKNFTKFEFWAKVYKY